MRQIIGRGTRPSAEWISVAAIKPPNGIAVLTMIDDEKGRRNEQPLIRKDNLWFHDDMSMYVYYTPTHWKYI